MRAAGDLPAAWLIEISAQDHGIDVAAEHLEHMEVNGRIHIEVGPVTKDRIFPFGAAEGGAEFIEKGFEIFFLGVSLRQANGPPPGSHKNPPAPPAKKPPPPARAKPIELEQITAGDIWSLQIFRSEA